jgi:hypothetical protein
MLLANIIEKEKNDESVLYSPDQLEHYITTILKMKTALGESLTIKERTLVIEQLLDFYINRFGEVPKGNQIQRLANWLLLENLKNAHPDKVTREEYPIMTKRQLKARYRREMANESIPETYTGLYYLKGKKQTLTK